MEETKDCETKEEIITNDPQKSNYIKSMIKSMIGFIIACVLFAGSLIYLFLFLAPNYDEGINSFLTCLLAIFAVVLLLLMVSMIQNTFADDEPDSCKNTKYVFGALKITFLIASVIACILSVVLVFKTIGTTFEKGDFSDTHDCISCMVPTPANGGRAIFRTGMSKEDVEIQYFCDKCFILIQEEINKDKNKNSDIDESDVWSEAKDIVRNRLKAPSTAEFCSKSSATITKSGKTWTIRGYVDAENSFGAMIRNDFTVVITFTSDTDYTIDRCTITAR